MLRKKKDKGNKRSQDHTDENAKEKAQEMDPSISQQEESKTKEAEANQARLNALMDKFLLGEITEEQYLKARKNILEAT